MHHLLDDLAAEHADLESLVVDLDEARWDTPTPARPWTIRDQIGHLAFFDERAAMAVSDPEAFAAEVNTGFATGAEAYLSRHIEVGRSMPAAELVNWWRTARTGLIETMGSADPDRKLPWYGPPMKAKTSVVARLMETWAHGQDVADALGVVRAPSERLRHIAELGVKTFAFGFSNRGLEVPDTRVRVALRGPTGTLWVWNDEYADSVTGPAEEFCLVVAQRRHIADTHLVVEGEVAHRWMEAAQIFAGPPGPGREPVGSTR